MIAGVWIAKRLCWVRGCAARACAAAVVCVVVTAGARVAVAADADAASPPAASAPSRPADAGADAAAIAEPNIEIARTWWPPLENTYTPIGWKNHLFRFNVYYNGMVMANPQPETDVRALDPWHGLGAQLTIQPSEHGLDPNRWRGGTYQMTGDNGRRWSYQGLLDRPTPAVWTEWRQSFRAVIGYILRQEAFAHVPGGREIETGTEPLFAWIRMSIGEVNPLMTPEPCWILVRINKPHIFPEMYTGRHCALRRTDSRYPRALTLAPLGDSASPGGLVIEPDGKVRLGVLPGRASMVRLDPPTEDGQDVNLHVVLPVHKGAFVDLLVPMLPMERETFDAEMRMGRDAALAECDAYWSKTPPTAARIDTPERYVNEYLRRNAQFGELIAQRMPDSGLTTNLTGSMQYARMWATPTTMFDTMLLDTLGYHDAVARYLEIFRATQGDVKPPGPSYTKHPGYFGGPASVGGVNWLADHGAVLHAVCYHALVTDDAEFIDRWLEPIVRACDFIRESRARTNHDGVPGVLPPAVATDQFVPTQAVWNVGWHYRGLTSAVQLLERRGDPRAAEFAAEAREYRKVFVAALRKATEAGPTWTDSHGCAHHLVPTSLSAGGDVTHGFYLDTGPLFLVYAGLLSANDPLMQSTLLFFREGPNHLVFDPYGHFEQPPVLVRELSSCEPCASFNLFHSHQLADRARFLEGMYSMLTGAHSQQTYIACETRGGITGIVGHIGIYAVRLSAVDDLIEPKGLHLLRLVPRAWLREDRWTRFENVPTVYGPVTVRFRLEKGGATLHAEYEARYHHRPEHVVLHVPPVAGMKEVVINGQTHAAHAGDVISVE